MADQLRYFEDFAEGEEIISRDYEITREETIAFAAEFDPQPFHLDEEAAKKSLVGGLCTSGWHTCSIMNRLLVDSYASEAASMGSFGLEEVNWLKPVFVGDHVHVVTKVLSKRISGKRPEMGILQMRWEMFDQAGELKMSATGTNLMQVKNVAGAA